MSTVSVAQEQIRALRDCYDQLEGLAKALHESPELREKFVQDPEGTALAVNGLVVPQPFRLRYTDDTNIMYPPEEKGVYTRDRVEIRVAHQKIAVVVTA